MDESRAREVHRLFAGQLAARGLRLTWQRLRILDLLLTAGRHVPLERINRTLRQFHLGRTTVFRTLRMLEACGVISRVEDARGAPCYEICAGQPLHDHLICLRCGGITGIPCPGLSQDRLAACTEAGFRPARHRLEIFGVCSACHGGPDPEGV